MTLKKQLDKEERGRTSRSSITKKDKTLETDLSQEEIQKFIEEKDDKKNGGFVLVQKLKENIS
jgi:Ca2+-binding EF-hand superfamily protein